MGRKPEYVVETSQSRKENCRKLNPLNELTPGFEPGHIGGGR